MEQSSIKVLVVDGSDPARTIQTALLSASNGAFSVETVSNLPAAPEYLHQQPADVVCLNLSTTDTAAETAFKEISAVNPNAALVALAPDEETGNSQAIQSGAQDIILPVELTPRSVSRILRHAVERKQADETLRQTQARLGLIFESVQDYAIF